MSPNIKIKWKKQITTLFLMTEIKNLSNFTSGIFASSLGYKNKNLNHKIKKVLINGFSHN